MRNFQELKVWNKAHEVTLAAYKATAGFPKQEMFGLTSQIRRAVSSIGANIAKGAGGGTNADFVRFLQISLGSANELHNHLLLARDLGLIVDDDFERLLADVLETQKMLAKFVQYLTPKRNLIPNT